MAMNTSSSCLLLDWWWRDAFLWKKVDETMTEMTSNYLVSCDFIKNVGRLSSERKKTPSWNSYWVHLGKQIDRNLRETLNIRSMIYTKRNQIIRAMSKAYRAETPFDTSIPNFKRRSLILGKTKLVQNKSSGTRVRQKRNMIDQIISAYHVVFLTAKKPSHVSDFLTLPTEWGEVGKSRAGIQR